MSITAYTGLPGHGKSYGVVANVIVPALKQGRRVWTNIPMNEDVLMQRFSCSVTQFQMSDVVDNPDWFQQVFEAGAVLVMDELWRLWKSGVKSSNMLEQHKSFLAEHRHMVGHDGKSTEVVFVTQNLSQIAAFPRDLVELTYVVHKAVQLGSSRKYRVDMYYGPITGTKPPVSKRENTIHGSFSDDIYALYQSHTLSDVGAGDETKADRRANLLTGQSMRWYLVAMFFALLITYKLGVYAYANLFPTSEEVDLSSQVSSSPNVPVIPQTQQPINQSSQPIPEPLFEFLSKAESIHIVFNNGYFPDIDFKYRVVFDDYEATLTSDDLALLDYDLTPINPCLVRISGDDYFGVAMCQRSDHQDTLMDPQFNRSSTLM